MRRLGRSAPALAALGLLACAQGSTTPNASPTPPASVPSPTPPSNVQPIVVDAGPSQSSVNLAFTTLTVCVPGTSSCQTLDHVIVDTGSSGLRLLSSALTIPLPPMNDPAGAPIGDCTQFVEGYLWGPVLTADVQIAGARASNIPVQALAAPGFPGVPSACSSSGPAALDTLTSVGAAGLLGVGLFQQDCGPACAASGASNPGLYYSCPASGCGVVAQSVGLQVTNPVARFPTDNNGVLIQLPAVPPGGAASVNGSMIFGIGTRPNNSLGTATVYRPGGSGEISTVFRGQSFPASYIDSGSNGIYFLDAATTGLATCTKSSSFYCPSGPVSLSATIQGSNGSLGSLDFTIANADALFAFPYAALPELGGPAAGTFDWGLPVFYGRSVFTAIELANTPAGPGPYFAY